MTASPSSGSKRFIDMIGIAPRENDGMSDFPSGATGGFSRTPNILGIDGPVMSPSSTPTLNPRRLRPDRKSTRLNSSHLVISYAVFCLKKKHSSTLVGNRRSGGRYLVDEVDVQRVRHNRAVFHDFHRRSSCWLTLPLDGHEV